MSRTEEAEHLEKLEAKYGKMIQKGEMDGLVTLEKQVLDARDQMSIVLIAKAVKKHLGFAGVFITADRAELTTSNLDEMSYRVIKIVENMSKQQNKLRKLINHWDDHCDEVIDQMVSIKVGNQQRNQY
jgi:DNA-binding transcriptional regulator YbjK